jgi:hypothetical protein
VDARNKPIEEIRATITALRKRGEIDAVVIDYIQKFSSNQVKGTTGTALMKYVCDELNGLANDTSLPIITGAQFNRNVDFLYQVSELAIREADDITHLGALILGIYNNDIKQKVANNDATDEDKDKQSQYGHPNTFYVEVLKNRFGTPGIGFNMAYNGPLQTLGNYYHGAGVIGIDQQAETTQPKILPRATRPEKPLTLNTQLNRIKEWAKDQANAGIDIEKGLQIFTENNPSITITEAHTIAYNSVYKTTVTNNQRKAQVIEEAKQKQDKKTKPTK